jgi:hypothetical protein
MKLFSNIISFVFHPLLMVTYGIVLALMFTFLAIYPLPVKLLIAGGTFISTARAFHLLIGEKWRGRRYRAFRPEGAGGSLSDFYHFHLGMYLFPV